MSDPKQPCPPVIRFEFKWDIDLNINVRCAPCPPRGIRAGVLYQTFEKKGSVMAANGIYPYTPDIDPLVVNTAHTWLVNGAPVGVVNQPTPPPNPGQVAYFDLSPPGPALLAGQTLQVSTVTTDSIGQTSPAILSNVITIAAAPPPPVGITPGTLTQSGSP